MTRCARTPHLQGNGLRATARRFRTGNPGRHSERKGINPVNARVLILGLALKENCPGLCNTRVVDILQALQGYNARVDVHDPWVNAAEAQHEYGITPIAAPEQGLRRDDRGGGA